MRRFVVTAMLVGMAACGGGGGHSTSGPSTSRDVVLESESLQGGDFNSCDVVGTVFNTSRDKTCSTFLQFGGFNSAGTEIASGNDFPSGIPPQTRATYSATLLANGNFIACSQIASFRLTDSNVFCN